MKSSPPSMLVDGERLALETLICTDHGMGQLRHWARPVESKSDAIKGAKDNQASIEGKTGGNGDSKQNSGVDGTTSSVSVIQ